MTQESRLAIIVDSSGAKTDVDKLNAALRDLETQGVRVTGVSDRTGKGLSDVGKSAKDASGSIAEMATALGSVISVAKLWNEVESATLAAGRYEQIGIIMEVVGRNAGYSANELGQLQGQLEKTGISMTQSRQVITQMIQAQMDLTQATQLARLAQDAATIGNTSSSEALERLVYGVQTAQVEILRNIGIVVNFEAAYKDLADELGRTTASLTEQEKMTARVNAVMAQGGAIAGSYEASMENANKQMGSMARHADNLQVNLGKAFQPAFSQVIETMTNALKVANDNAGGLSIALAGVTAAAAVSTTGILALRGGVLALNVALNAMRGHPVIMALSVIAGAAAAAGVAFTGMGGGARTASADIDELTRSLESLNREQLAFRQQQAEEKLAALQDEAALAARELQALEKDYGELVKMFEAGRGVDAEGLENVNRTLVEQRARVADANQEVEKARGVLERLNEQARATAGGITTLNDALAKTNEAGKSYLERLSDQAITAGLKTQREQLEALVAAKKLEYSPEDLEKARKAADHIDRMTAALRAGTQATKDHASAMKSLLETHLPQNAALVELHKNLELLGKAQKAGIVVGADYVKALASINFAYAKQVQDLLPESIKRVNEAVKAAKEQENALRQQLRTFGLAESAVLDLAAADTHAAIAKLEAEKATLAQNDATEERIQHIDAEIAKLRELANVQTGMAGLQRQAEWLQAEKAAWESWSRDVETIFQQVGQSLTDAIFEGGKSGRDLIKDLFKTLTLRVVINPVMGALQNAVTNSLGGAFGYSNPAQQGGAGGIMGMLGQANQLYGAMTGGMSSSLATGISSLGQKMGSEALSNFAAGMKGSTLAPGLHGPTTAGASGATGAGSWIGSNMGSILGYGAAFYNLTQGNYGSAIGTAIGTAILPGVGTAIGSVAGGLVDGVFGDREPTTRREQRTQIEFANGLFGTTRTDDRMPGADAAARALAEQAVSTANDIFKQVGVDAAIDSFHAIMASSYKGDRDGVASGGMLRIGDEYRQFGIANEGNPTIQGFGGWSDVDPMARIGTEIQLSVLEAFQAVGDQLPTVLSDMLGTESLRGLNEGQIQEITQRFTALIEGTNAFLHAAEQLPFANLRDLSFDAAASMLQFAGGVENLLGAQQTYYERFYSDAERHGYAVEQLTQALAGVGVEIPAVTGSLESMLGSYRTLVEAQDLNTESGRQAYVALMQAAGAFAEVATYAAESVEAVRSAAEIARERAGLETQLLQLQGNTAELRRRELQALDPANRAMQEHIWALQDQAAAVAELGTAYNAVVQAGQAEIRQLQQSFGATDSAMSAYRSQVQRRESEIGGLLSAIGRGVADLRGQVDTTAQMQYEQARAVISTSLVTGALPQSADLTEALRVAQQGVTGQVYGSLVDQQRAYVRLANEMEALKGIAEPELDTAQATLSQLEEQYALMRGTQRIAGDSLSALEQQVRVALSTEGAARTQISLVEQQLEATRQHYEALTGIKTSIDGGVTTLASALASFASATAKVPAPVGGGGSSGGGYYADKLAQLQATGSTHGGIDWSHATTADLAAYFASEGLTPEEHWERWGKQEGLRPPGFAAGGMHMGGLRFVGERGIELEATGPSRIYSNSQTTDILRNAMSGGGQQELVAEVRALRAEVARLTAVAQKTSGNTARSARANEQLADQFDQVTEGGNASRVVNMETVNVRMVTA